MYTRGVKRDSVYKYQGWQKVAILGLIFTVIIFLKVRIVKAADVNYGTVTRNEDCKIFSFSKDGYWKPSDSVTHNFIIENGAGVDCYLDGFTFSNSYIKDINTGREYTVQDAINDGIIQDYNVTLSVNDNVEGNSELFLGKFNDLILNQVKFENPIEMDTQKQVQFKIDISFDPQAGNQYQNKAYEFSLAVQAHKSLYPNYDNKLPNIKYRYIDDDGNWRTDGYFDDNHVWHVPGYWDKNGVFHQDILKNPTVSEFGNYINNQIKNKIINSIFKTGDNNQDIINNKIIVGVSSIFLFIVLLIIRKKHRL